MEKLGVAFLGLDHWYAAFDLLGAAARSERVRVVAVAHDDAVRGEQAAREAGAAIATTDYRAALDRPDVQLVAVLYSSDRAAAVCREAAALGKQIVCVKPMARDLADADSVVAAVRSAGVTFFPLDCNGRLRPDLQRTRAWLREGRIGRPLRYLHTLHASLPMAWPGHDDPGWWTDPARVPGGAWLDHAIYAIDTARWLLGAEPASVAGIYGRQRYPELPVEDFGIAAFTFANGAVAVIEDTWTSDRGYGLYRNELIGSAGAIVEESGGRLALRGAFGFDDWVVAAPARGPHQSAIEHVAACIRGEAEPLATVEDGRANLAACLAFYQKAIRV